MCDTSFEPHGDGYVFYRNAWSLGIPVTAEEREASLQPPFWLSRLALQRKISGRPPALPRRSWLLGQRRMLRAIPGNFGFTLLLAALAVMLHAQGHEPAALRWAQTGLGIVFALYGATNLILRSRG